MRESSIETHLVRMVRDRGGLCFKFVSPGNPGVPDRIVITPAGRKIGKSTRLNSSHIR